jgi:hypothetical protein
MPRLPRPIVAIVASIAAHVALGGVMVGTAVWRGISLAPRIDAQLVAVEIKQVEELPLGPPPPPPGAGEATAGAPAPPRRPRARSAAAAVVARGPARPDGGAGDGGAPDAGAAGGQAAGDAGPPGVDGGTGRRRRDLSAYGPEGSRVTAILRLDRLRQGPEAGPTIAAVDELLKMLPDRRRLLEGTGLDLYRDFDAILIATPNPLDDAVTFLAARHKLTDEALKTALEAGAAHAGRPLRWQPDAPRPVGLRGTREGAPPDRDDRILVLPQPGLVVMAPPAYASLLLPKPSGEAPSGKAPPWRELIARIDAQDGTMPEDAVLMMTAANVFRGAGARAPTGPFGLPLPPAATLIVGTDPTPFLELVAEFPEEGAARRWEESWPALRQVLVGNPLLLLSGFTALAARAELSREDSAVMLRLTSTGPELRRVLLAIAGLVRGGAR